MQGNDLQLRGETGECHLQTQVLRESSEKVLSETTVCLFFVLWAYMSKFSLVTKMTSEHYSAIWTRSSVVERYLQDGLNEPKKPPIAYWKACVQKVLIF